MDITPAPDDLDVRADDVLASLDDLRRRIEVARTSESLPVQRPGRAVAVVVGAVVALLGVIGLVVAGIAVIAGGDDGDASVAVSTPTTAVAAPTTATAAPSTTASAPSTSAAPAPSATAAPAPSTTALPAPDPTPTAPTPTVPPAADDVAAPPPTPVGSVTVSVGDSFWTLAEREASARVGRAPTLAEVTRLWADMVEANADRLVQQGNPDLVLPGQVLVLPPIGPSP